MPRSLTPFPTWGAVLVAAVGTWPWWGWVPLEPTTTDGVLWIARSLPPGGWRWVLLGPHFVGYRPVAALSFALDGLAGLHPELCRLTQLLLLGSTALLVAVAAHRLTGGSRTAALLAPLFFLGHPALAESVPYLARRSYLLADLFAAAALVSALGYARLGTRSRLLAVGGSLLLALLSNEEAYALVPVLPFVAPPGPRRRALLLPAGASALLALALRFAATSRLGGYAHGAIAPRLIPRALVEAGTSILFPSEPLRAFLPLALLLLYLLGLLLLGPRVARGLLAWAAAHLALSLATGGWYPRQAVSAALPLAVLAAFLLFELVQGSRRWLHLPLLLLLAGWAEASPLLRGPAPQRLSAAEAHHQRLLQARRDLGALEGPATVLLITPVGRAQLERNLGGRHVWYQGRRTSAWLRLVLAGHGLSIHDLAFVQPPSGSTRDLHIEPVPGQAFAWRIPPGSRVYLPHGPWAGRVTRSEGGGWLLSLPAKLPDSPAPRYLYTWDGSSPRLFPLQVSRP